MKVIRCALFALAAQALAGRNTIARDNEDPEPSPAPAPASGSGTGTGTGTGTGSGTGSGGGGTEEKTGDSAKEAAEPKADPNAATESKAAPQEPETNTPANDVDSEAQVALVGDHTVARRGKDKSTETKTDEGNEAGASAEEKAKKAQKEADEAKKAAADAEVDVAEQGVVVAHLNTEEAKAEVQAAKKKLAKKKGDAVEGENPVEGGSALLGSGPPEKETDGSGPPAKETDDLQHIKKLKIDAEKALADKKLEATKKADEAKAAADEQDDEQNDAQVAKEEQKPDEVKAGTDGGAEAR